MIIFNTTLLRTIFLCASMILLVSCESEQKTISTAASNVEVLTKLFEVEGLNRTRNIRIYLPPNYSNTERRYPVLYMHDGQNLFDDKTSYVGEWGVDETLNKLHEEKKLSLIVVGIDNGQQKRMNELSPWENNKYGVAEGQKYMQFVVEQVKPYIDRNYRTLKDKKHTGVMGSSMGGLISHYAILKYSNVFSKAGIFSPSFWFSEKVYPFSERNKPNQESRLFYLMGENEGSDTVANMQKMVEQITAQGHPTENVISRVVAGGEHNEGFWREEFERAVLWLFQVE